METHKKDEQNEGINRRKFIASTVFAGGGIAITALPANGNAQRYSEAPKSWLTGEGQAPKAPRSKGWNPLRGNFANRMRDLKRLTLMIAAIICLLSGCSAAQQL